MEDYSRGGGQEYLVPPEQLEEASAGKKYGGLQPKKRPLITQDHARTFFDSADWALHKQGAGSNREMVALETLRPKLQEE